MTAEPPAPPRRGPRRAQRAAGGAGSDAATPSGAERSSDDTDLGWGEAPTADDDERHLRERPPHCG